MLIKFASKSRGLSGAYSTEGTIIFRAGLWGALYVEGVTHPTWIGLDVYHYSKTWEAIYREMVRLTTSDAEFQVIKLKAILGKLEPTPTPPVVPDPKVSDLDVPELLLPPVVPIVVPEIDDEGGDNEDIENDEKAEMDLEEL